MSCFEAALSACGWRHSFWVKFTSHGCRVVEVELSAPIPADLLDALGAQAWDSLESTEFSGFAGVLKEFGVARAEYCITDFLESIKNDADFRQPGDGELEDSRRFLIIELGSQKANLCVRQLRQVEHVFKAKVRLPVLPASVGDPWVQEDPWAIEEFLDDGQKLERQWYIPRCGVQEAWKETLSGSGVSLFVLDWGFWFDHPEFQNLSLGESYNSCDGSADVGQGSCRNHGTGVVGLIAAAADDNKMGGISPGVQIWPVQANFGAGSSLGGDPWARAIVWARLRKVSGNQKKRVILVEAQTGAGENVEALLCVNRQIRLAIQDQLLVCVPAGNRGINAGKTVDRDEIPETGSILVGATVFDKTSEKAWSSSNHGPRVTVFAPGDKNHDLTCRDGSDQKGFFTRRFGGTSGAAAKVAAVLALMVERKDATSPSDAISILRKSNKGVASMTGARFLDASVIL
jgi:subtilisin family serine protease